MTQNNEKKWALVTGANGHTGSFLVHELVNNGWHVVATDLRQDSRKKLMTKETVFRSDLHYMSIDLEQVKFIAADLTNRDSLKELFSVDLEGSEYQAIFHPASLYDYFAELDLLRKINVEGLRNFLEVIKEYYNKKKKKMPHFLHWSTCGVYGEPEYEKTPDGFDIPADETAPYDPPNDYSISKKEQELLLKSFAEKNNLKYTIIRPAPIYGPYQTYGMYHIFLMFNKMGNGPVPHIYPRKKQLMMPMVHVEDLVRAAAFLANNPKAYGEAFNVVGDSTTQEEWMECMFHELGISYWIVPMWWPIYIACARTLYKWAEGEAVRAKKRNSRPKFDLPMADYITHQYYFTNEKIKALGFKFKYNDHAAGTRQTIRWYIDHGWLLSEDWHKDQRYFKEKVENAKEVK
ncbi:MAG: NAD-dependent epimerase/dehydratase family protein [Candidatus Lokiarchaeota archaeon]|nr:NAD-dependent epimerase/dehydratase family protein [Candidatus Lokiarchaeota archaeon]